MATKIPSYEYTGTHSSELKGGYWYIYLKSSGTLKFTYDKKAVAACIVGGGAGGKGDRIGHREDESKDHPYGNAAAPVQDVRQA